METVLTQMDVHPEIGKEVMAFYLDGHGNKCFDYAVWNGEKWGVNITPEGEFIGLPEYISYIGWAPIKEVVNHPDHYIAGKFECRDVMIEVFGKEYYIAFCKLSAFKYLFRGGKKEGNSEKQDLKKAVWYLNDVIELSDD